MLFSNYNLCLLPLSISLSLADWLGPTFPAPLDLSSEDSLVRAAWEDLSSTLDTYLKDGKRSDALSDLTGSEKVTWSTGMWSLHDPAASEFQYHWTSPEIANAEYGTNQVDGDSIYRVASVSKLITVLAGLVELTDEEWNRPLSEAIPGLGSGGDGGPLDAPQWDKITPWALANQQSGITTFGLPLYDLIGQTYTVAALTTNTSITALETADGFPPELWSSLGPCTDQLDPYCEADDFIASVKSFHPNFLPWTTPAYSNFGLMMLGLSISNITGKTYGDIYSSAIFGPLGMSSSLDNAPTEGADFDRSVIPGDPEVSFITPGSQITVPSGGILSTINDLAKLGLGILNSTLLTPEQTREWMKPHTHTASLTYSIGAPWEIVRYIHPDTGKVTDIYTKLGDSGPFGGILALIPDYNAGFSFLNAASNQTLRSPVALNVINRIAESIMPALEAQARVEANRNFVGKYVCSDSSLNSSVTVSLNESTIDGPTSGGLSISSWISNGTDMLPFFGDIKPQILPTIPKQGDGSGQVAFQATYRPQWNSYPAAQLGPFSGFYDSNFDWASIDQNRYGGKGVGLFVFDVDADGEAKAVKTPSTKVTLKKK